MTKKIDRRTFLKAAGMGGASTMVALSGAISADRPEKKVPTRVFGKTGVKVPILALGGGVDFTQNRMLLKIALDLGVSYWDTANNYVNGNSERGIGRYFERFPEDRKRVFLCTKASGGSEPEVMTKELHLSLDRLRTNTIDLYFIHGMKKPDLLAPKVKAWAEKAKSEGKIRFFGFSTHSNMAPMLLRASKLGWIDGIMTSYNYHLMLEDDMKRAIDACHRAGIGLTAMKTQGEFFKFFSTGKELSLARTFMSKGYTIEQAKLRTVWNNETIATCCSKMKNVTTLNANVAAAVGDTDLSSADLHRVGRYANASRQNYCSGCSDICEAAPGRKCHIADVLRYMMYHESYGETDEARRLFAHLPEDERNSMASRDYSEAELRCPHNIEIGKMMRKAVTMLS